MAVQICTVRYVGRFLGENPLAVPWEAVEYLAGQLGIADTSCVKRYPERRSTVYEHAAEIQERFKYRDFTDRPWGREFRGFLYGRAWTHAGWLGTGWGHDRKPRSGRAPGSSV
jgi:hypothetical protein